MENHPDQLVNIPKTFHSFHLEGPFDRCIECDKYLLAEGCEYVIEKAVRNYPGYKTKDVIFDYAICMECASDIQQRLSKKSQATIQQFMENRIAQRSKPLYKSDNVDELISRCLISENPMDTCTEYQLFAFCNGDKLNLAVPPYMISGEILDEISELLSDKTRDELDGFFNKHFSPSPGLMQPDPRLILF